MPSSDSAFGVDRSDHASSTTQRELELAMRRGTAPIHYQLIWERLGGNQQVGEFYCRTKDRLGEMRRLGCDPDNHRWALRSRGQDGRWTEPIGNDHKLKTELKRRR